MGNIIGLPGLDVVIIGFEKDNLPDQVEFDEEIITKTAGVLNIVIWSLTMLFMSLKLYNFYLTLVSPPPKHI